MPSRMIDFGSAVYPNVGNNQQLNESVAARLVDGFINELKQYIKRKGLTVFSTLGAGNAAVDGLYRTKGVSPGTILAVAGGVVYSVPSSGLETAFTGSALNTGTPIIFTEDVSFVYAAHGGRIARLNLSTNVVTLLTGGNAPDGVLYVTYLDGFLIAVSGSTGTKSLTYFSDDLANNYEAANSWEFYDNEAVADTATAVVAQWKEVYNFGPDSLEITYNDGSTPFAKYSGGHVPYGLAAVYSLANVDNTLYYLTFVDGGIRVVKLEGRRPVIVSEPQDTTLNGLTTVSDGRGFILAHDGKPFYCVTFPTDNITLTFNLRTRTWSNIALWNGATYDRFQGQCSVFWPEQKKFLIGSRTANGKIYTYSGLTDDGSLIRFELTSNVHRWGTSHKKRCDRLVFNSTPSAPFKYRNDEASLGTPAVPNFAHALTSFMARSDGFTYTNRWGAYKARIHQLVHDDTVTDFTLLGAEEWFQILSH